MLNFEVLEFALSRNRGLALRTRLASHRGGLTNCCIALSFQLRDAVYQTLPLLRQAAQALLILRGEVTSSAIIKWFPLTMHSPLIKNE